MDLIRRALGAYFTFAFVFVVLGICFLAWPQTSMMTVCYILGAVTLAWGLVKISGFVKNKDKNKSFSFQFSLIIGIFLTIAGALLIVFPRFILPVIPIIMGIMLTADGIHKLKVGFDAKAIGHGKWWLIEILAVITAVFGFCLIINNSAAVTAIIVLLGVSLLIDGVQNIIVIVSTFKLMSKMNAEEKAREEFKSDDIPNAPYTDESPEKINPDDMIIEDKKD